MASCVKLAGVPVCGYRGRCVNSTICVCESGWEKNAEFALYLDENEFSSDDVQVCDTNVTILIVLYAVTLIVAVLMLVAQKLRIKQLKQAKRLLPLTLNFVFIVVFCIVKVSNPRERLVGIDLVATILYALVHLSGNIAAVTFYNKYISYHARSNPIAYSTQKKAKFNAEQLKKFQNASVFVDFAITLLIFASGLTDFDKDVGLLKAALMIHSLRAAYFVWASMYYLDLLLVDLRRVYKTAMDLENERNRYSYRSTGTVNGTMKRVLKLHSHQIIALVRIKKAAVAYNSLIFLVHFIAVAWEMWLSAFKYLIPIQWILGIILAYVIMISTEVTRSSSSRTQYPLGQAATSVRLSSGSQKLSSENARNSGSYRLSNSHESGASKRFSRFYNKVKSVRLNNLVGTSGPWSIEFEH